MAVLCGAALVGACSQDEPAPAPEPSSATSTTGSAGGSASGSASPTSEPTEAPAPEPPALPSEATTPDAAGAAAFVRHWFDLVNYAYATGDTGPLVSASDTRCETCSSFIDSIESQYSSGGSFTGGAISVLDAVAPEPDPHAPSLVTSLYSQEAIAAVSSEGEVTAETPAEPSTTIAFYVARNADAWVAFEIGGQAS